MFVITLPMIIVNETGNLSPPKNISIILVKTLRHKSIFHYVPISSGTPAQCGSTIHRGVVSEAEVSSVVAPSGASVGHSLSLAQAQVTRDGGQLSCTGVGSLDVDMTRSCTTHRHRIITNRFGCQS